MPRVRKTASVAPRTVTAVSKGEVSDHRIRSRRSRAPLAVTGEYVVRIDPRIMAVLHEQGTDFHCVEVVSSTEVIVHNHRIR